MSVLENMLLQTADSRQQTADSRQQTRVLWLDIVRTFAVLVVILVHATENLYIMDVAHLNSMSTDSRTFAVVVFTIGRLGVPLFLFLTGYLFFQRKFDRQSIFKFWHRNWLGLLVTTEIWVILYDVFLRAFHFQHWSTKRLVYDMLFMDQVHMGHMWYMPMIIGLYICIPFAARALKSVDLQIIKFPILILSLYAFGIPVLVAFNQAMFQENHIRLLLDLGFSGGVYGLYLVFGWCIRCGLFRVWNTVSVTICSLICFGITVGIQLFSYSRGVTYNVWYNYGFLMLCALFLFEGFSRLPLKKEYKTILWLSRNSFGIYLIHYPILLLLKNIILQMPCMMPVKVIFLWIIVLGVSCCFCYVINISPKLSRLLLYNR